jgi:hypothetical protein
LSKTLTGWLPAKPWSQRGRVATGMKALETNRNQHRDAEEAGQGAGVEAESDGKPGRGLQTGLTTGATTRMIDRLERGGFVRRGRDGADRRQVIVEACEPDGSDEISAALEPARRRMQAVFQRYTAKEVRVLVDYFTHAAPALLAAVEDLRDRPAQRFEGGAGSEQDGPFGK